MILLASDDTLSTQSHNAVKRLLAHQNKMKCMLANKDNINLKTRTSFFLDLAQNAEQCRFHSVTVECMFPVHKDKSMTCSMTTCKSTKTNKDTEQPPLPISMATLANVSFWLAMS